MSNTNVELTEIAIELNVGQDTPTHQGWAEYALCRGKTELFFAPPGERSQRRARREAFANSYCDQCAAKLACRQWARTHRESGFWGGESDEQRAAAGYPPRSPNRRAVAEAGRRAARFDQDPVAGSPDRASRLDHDSDSKAS